jgi:hypothetical protein
MFNASQTIEAIQRDDLSKEYGGTD